MVGLLSIKYKSIRQKTDFCKTLLLHIGILRRQAFSPTLIKFFDNYSNNSQQRFL